jgi:hypothetical protein
MNEFFASGFGIMTAGAVIGIAGVFVGVLAVKVPDWVLGKRKETGVDSSAARALAMRAVLALDDLVGACYAAVHDDPEFNPDDSAEFVFHTSEPTIVLPKDVDWTVLSPELADEILWIPNRTRNIVDALESLDVSPPDYDDYFERRREGYSRLGLRAIELMERLCEAYRVPTPERPDYYSPREGFVQKISVMEDLWKRRRKARENLPKGSTNVTPLFGGSRDDAMIKHPESDL